MKTFLENMTIVTPVFIAGCAWNEFMNVWAFLVIVLSSFISGMAIELIRREND